MNRLELVKRVRVHVNDSQSILFTHQEIVDFINEGIDRIKQLIDELSGAKHLLQDTDSPKYLPEQYHHLLSVYASARVSAKDQRAYEAATFMNEFETKLDRLKYKIEIGEVIILDEWGDPLNGYVEEYVKNRYFHPIRKTEE